MVVLEAVLDLDDHPTADRVHEAVARRDPGVSRATVYRALESLARIGVITKACHPGKAVRYDSRTEIHHHLVCLRCDTVVDIADERLDALPVPDTSSLGFDVSDFRVQLRGICRRCREQEEAQ
jgi:Fe2+ or Zn2+ uptake regulation protein